MKMSRRTLLSTAAFAATGLAGPAILRHSSNAAEFTYKCGASLPDGHPMAVRAREAMQKIKEESGGRLDITLYTNSVLGGDTAMISQTIAGALEMYTLPLDLGRPISSPCSSASARPRRRSILPRCTARCRRAWSTARRTRWC